MTLEHYLVLGVHPSSKGLGWALFDGPRSLSDWGTADIRNGDNVKVLLRLGSLLDKYEPHVLVLEEFEQSRRAARIKVLCRAMVARAELHDMTVRRFARAKIATALQADHSRHAIAAVVAEQIDDLRALLPQKRRAWESERLKSALFSAAACGLAHYSVRQV